MTQLTTVNNNALAELQDLSGQIGGLVQVRQELLKPLVIKLCQAMSRSVSSETAKIGDFVCETSGANFGKEFTFIPILVKESASLMFNANNPPRGLSLDHDFKDSTPICYTKDLIKNKDGINCNKCPFGEYWNHWEKDAKGNSIAPKCKTSIDIFCIPEGTSKTALFQLRKTSYKAGKDIINKIMASGPVPFLSKFTVKTKDEVNDSGQRYKVIDPSATVIVKLTDEELSEYAGVIRSFLLAQKNNTIDYDVVEDERSEVQKDADAMPF